jgi:hypothetical protein
MSCDDVTKTASFTFYVTCLRDQNAPIDDAMMTHALQARSANPKNQNDAMSHSDKKKRHCSVTLGPRAHFNTVQESL